MESLATRMKRGEKLLGTMLSFTRNPDISLLLKNAGMDFFMIDCEHGFLGLSETATMISMGKQAGIPVLVRIPELRRELVGKYLDMGATGLMLPNTDNADLAREFVRLAKYAPMGRRGVAMGKAHSGYCSPSDGPAYMQQANENTILIAQIESPEGVSNLQEILSVDGIDVALVGPNDLSHSLGVHKQYQHPSFVAAMEQIIRTAKACGKQSGIHTAPIGEVNRWAQQGMNFSMCSGDIDFLIAGAKACVEGYQRA